MKPPHFLKTERKDFVFETITDFLEVGGYQVKEVDDKRPWGGYFRLPERQADKFVTDYFNEFQDEFESQTGHLSPKILVVAPGKRLSWQYHKRRAEIWRVVAGPVGAISGDGDRQGRVKILHDGQVVKFGVTRRHRLVGLDGWGLVAEIWMHSDPVNPSDEEDIIRIEDDFGRS